MESILTSIKKLLGIAEEYRYFDDDLVMHINSVFATLAQLGVGPSKGFNIYDSSETWDDFTADKYELAPVKSYVFLKVKLLFDPPTNSAVTSSMERQISEFEWRLHLTAENPMPVIEEDEDE